jgi:hypothetical protein
MGLSLSLSSQLANRVEQKVIVDGEVAGRLTHVICGGWKTRCTTTNHKTVPIVFPGHFIMAILFARCDV